LNLFQNLKLEILKDLDVELKRKVVLCYLFDHIKKFHHFLTLRRSCLWIWKLELWKNGLTQKGRGPACQPHPPLKCAHHRLVTALATCGHAATPPSTDLHTLPSACTLRWRALPCFPLPWLVVLCFAVLLLVLLHSSSAAAANLCHARQGRAAGSLHRRDSASAGTPLDPRMHYTFCISPWSYRGGKSVSNAMLSG
jgi:hypothetical protein